MVELNTTIDVFCKSVRSVGIPKIQERKIESTFARLLQNSGQQWLSQRLKLVEQEATDSMASPQHDPIPNLPFRKSTKANRNYRDDGINTLSQLSPEYRLTVASVMRRSMQRPINKKDFVKAQKTIQSEPLDIPDYYHNLIEPISKHNLNALESNIRRRFEKQDLFSFSMLKASVTPSGVKVAESYKDVNGIDKFRPVTKNYVKAWELEINQTPQQARYSAFAFAQLLSKSNDSSPNSETLKFLGKNVLRHARDDTANTYGSLGFIPQPGLKTRVVANVNRTVNAMLTPFGETTQKMMDSEKHSGVRDQTSTHLWAKDMIANGNEIQSVDMTAATDLLDKSIYYDLFRNIDANEHPYLNQSLRLFMASTDGKYHSRYGDLSFTRGQPLGARPSFPLLTLANIALAKRAEKDAGLDPTKMNFMVVGDDIAMKSEMTDYYAGLLKAFGGDPNLDKSLKSSKMVEITGRLITADKFLRPKVRFSDSSDIPNPKERDVVNGLKGLRTTRETRKLFNAVSKQAINGINDNEILLVNQIPTLANQSVYSLLKRSRMEAISSVIAEQAAVPKEREISKSGLISRNNREPMLNSLTNVDKADIRLMTKISKRKATQITEERIIQDVEDKGKVLNSYPDQVQIPTPTVRKGVKTANTWKTLTLRSKLNSNVIPDLKVGDNRFMIDHNDLLLLETSNGVDNVVDLSDEVFDKQVHLIGKTITKNLRSLDLSDDEWRNIDDILKGTASKQVPPLPQTVARKISEMSPDRRWENVPSARALMIGSINAFGIQVPHFNSKDHPIPMRNNNSKSNVSFVNGNGDTITMPSVDDFETLNHKQGLRYNEYLKQQSSVPERHAKVPKKSRSHDQGFSR